MSTVQPELAAVTVICWYFSSTEARRITGLKDNAPVPEDRPLVEIHWDTGTEQITAKAWVPSRLPTGLYEIEHHYPVCASHKHAQGCSPIVVKVRCQPLEYGCEFDFDSVELQALRYRQHAKGPDMGAAMAWLPYWRAILERVKTEFQKELEALESYVEQYRKRKQRDLR